VFSAEVRFIFFEFVALTSDRIQRRVRLPSALPGEYHHQLCGYYSQSPAEYQYRHQHTTVMTPRLGHCCVPLHIDDFLMQRLLVPVQIGNVLSNATLVLVGFYSGSLLLSSSRRVSKRNFDTSV